MHNGLLLVIGVRQDPRLNNRTINPPTPQVIMSVLIFTLLGSISPDGDRTRADEVRSGSSSPLLHSSSCPPTPNPITPTPHPYHPPPLTPSPSQVRNGLFSTIAFILGAATSCLSGYLGMKIATYANARTAVEARRGIAPAFMCGE
jgi:hypothetical protein